MAAAEASAAKVAQVDKWAPIDFHERSSLGGEGVSVIQLGTLN